ncbi:hypothetical protein CDEST_05969 [Colletotrichum destructivum]|uniref:Uncharacterized protein n=1 Tax=Colletotrichum destructivum TaxID=34406 RepID=A0AAX4ID24_9PEZI|nr:hypothetical protein CDEST_05969 [Colletotrichum destructivum]
MNLVFLFTPYSNIASSSCFQKISYVYRDSLVSCFPARARPSPASRRPDASIRISTPPYPLLAASRVKSETRRRSSQALSPWPLGFFLILHHTRRIIEPRSRFLTRN